MSDLIKKAIALGLGITAVSREKVQQFVDEMVVKGELGKNEARDVVSRLIARGEEHRGELKQLVHEQVHKRLRELDVATKQDLIELERRLSPAAEAPAPQAQTAPASSPLGTPSPAAPTSSSQGASPETPAAASPTPEAPSP